MSNETFTDEYVLAQAVSANEQLHEIQDTSAGAIGTSGAIAGNIAIYDGAGYMPGGLVGPTGTAFSATYSPSLYITLAINNKPSFLVNSLGFTVGFVNVNPGSIAANTKGSIDVTISGIAAGDLITLEVPTTLDVGLLYVGHRIQAADTLRIYLYNCTGGAIDDGNSGWQYVYVKLT